MSREPATVMRSGVHLQPTANLERVAGERREHDAALLQALPR